MSTREQRSEIAHETVEVLERGFYETNTGKKVDIESELRYAIENTELFRSVDFDDIEISGGDDGDYQVEVRNETTLKAARRVAKRDSPEPFVLNFASARNPGGGFLNGSDAQEESLARATGLYACISEVTEYYQINRQSGTGLYTDNMIYSPQVPVIRDGRGDFLEAPFTVSILTAPAVNRRVVENEEPERLSEVEPAMDDRIRKVLLVASEKNHDILVLGAWGCGVFDNRVEIIGNLFKKHLEDEKTFKGKFENVIFAVLDVTPSRDTFNTFKRILEG